MDPAAGDRIGSGGMGEVWKATHRLLVRPAAIKLIKPEVLGAVTPEQATVLVQRFKWEARAAAALRSPHTTQLYDFGVANDGTFYYVMELLDGLDLQSLVARFGPVPSWPTGWRAARWSRPGPGTMPGGGGRRGPRPVQSQRPTQRLEVGAGGLRW